MDSKHLITFITLAKEKSLTKASMKLNYAVSTLSEHITILEGELGVKLVERNGRNIHITKNGESFLLFANKIMQTYREACDTMSYFAGVQGLKIITTESVALYTMPPIYTKFSTMYPDIELSVDMGNPNTFFDKVRNDEADIAFLFAWNAIREPGLLSTFLFQEPVVFVSHPTHPLAHKKAILPGDFQDEMFIFPQKDSLYRQALVHILKEHGVHIQSKLFMDSGSMIKKCIRLGHGISLLPYSIVQDSIAKGEIAQLKWSGPSFNVSAQAVIRQKEQIMPAISAIIDLAVNLLQPSTMQGNIESALPMI